MLLNKLKQLNKRVIILSWLALFLAISFLASQMTIAQQIISPIADRLSGNLQPLEGGKPGYEVFGFAPHWRMHKLDNVDFSVLTTLAYFGIEVNADGSLLLDDVGYQKFKSDSTTELFKKAHENNTRVVLTITQMDNATIRAILDDPEAQQRTIDQTVDLVQRRGIDGINIDFEYSGTPPAGYRDQYSAFVKNMSEAMHQANPNSRVTVSVYASAAKYAKLYNIGSIAQNSDGIFMMAYDFAVKGSDHAIPTAPLYGYREGKYWYDISTAVEDFLKVMPAEKLILGVPYYGYNYPVNNVAVKAARHEGYYTYYWRNRRRYSQYHSYPSTVQTYSLLKNEVIAENADAQTGWDDYGKVGYVAYQEDGVWRMVFMEDERSLGEKYDFAKSKNLAGVGMWALGFDDGRTELWSLLKLKFGEKLANNPTRLARIKSI